MCLVVYFFVITKLLGYKVCTVEKPANGAKFVMNVHLWTEQYS